MVCVAWDGGVVMSKMKVVLQEVAEHRARELLEQVDSSAFTDRWGPEKVLRTYDPKTGVRGVLVVDNTARGRVRVACESRQM